MKFRHVLACLMVGFATTAAFGDNPGVDHENGIYTVHVTEPGTFGLAFLQTVGGEGATETTDNDWTRVRYLTVTGTLNDDDLSYFVRMSNMDSLNVAQVAGIELFRGCKDLKKLVKVTLAPSMSKLGKETFRGCSALKEVNMEKVDSIGEYAFYECKSFAVELLPVVKYIGNSAFSYNKSLKKMDAPKCVSIGTTAFYNCDSLKRVNMPELLVLPYRCFASCGKLSSITFNDKVEVIGEKAFEGDAFTEFIFPSHLKTVNMDALKNNKLVEVRLPEGTKTVDAYAFISNPIETIVLPSTLQSLSTWAFSSTSYYEGGKQKYYLKHVYNYAVNPCTNQIINEAAPTATLHVPYMSIGNYKLSDAWYHFGSTVALEDDMENILITDEFFIISPLGIADKANVTVRSRVDIGASGYSSSDNTRGHLTVTSTAPFSMGKYTQTQHLQTTNRETKYDDLGITKYWYEYPYLTTMIAKSQARADQVETELYVPKDRWIFISFPYDVKVSNIEVPAGVQWTLRRYSGENRASGEGSTWLNLTSGETMEAHQGYILRCSSKESSYVRFLFPAEDNAHKNTLFSTTDVSVTLKEYAAEYANNRSWNLVGNPFAAFFFIQDLEYNAPITIYSNSGYQAYTPWDDEYVMRPNEAFFVQKPIDCDEIIFRHSGAQHSQTPPPSSGVLTRGMVSERDVFNFYLSGGEGADRARLVLNPQASAQFEMNWDAEKMMSDEAPQQIYMIESGLALAINERPAQVAPYAMGYTASEKGELTLAVEQKSSDYTIILHDALTGISADLSKGAYTFETEAGVFDSRFSVTIEAPIVTGVDAEPVQAVASVNGRTIIIDGNAVVYNAAGQLISKVENGGSLEVTAGLYIVKSAEGVQRILVK